VVILLAFGWAAIVHHAVLRVGRRVDERARARRRVVARRVRRHHAPVARLVPTRLRRMLAAVAAARARRRATRRFAHQVPVAIDLVRVAVHAGATPYGALALAADASPPLVADALTRVVHHVGVGAALPDALDHAADRDPPLRPLTEALALTHRLGAPLAPMLARAARDARRELRRQAEARARTVPVRLLFPLVFLVLPAFVVLTVVPALIAGWHDI
jgi:Flp pilus assembly protein TadB